MNGLIELPQNESKLHAWLPFGGYVEGRLIDYDYAKPYKLCDMIIH